MNIIGEYFRHHLQASPTFRFRKGYTKFRFYDQSPKICQVGIDANLKPLKCLKDQTEAAIATRPHICQLRTLVRVEKF